MSSTDSLFIMNFGSGSYTTVDDIEVLVLETDHGVGLGQSIVKQMEKAVRGNLSVLLRIGWFK